MVTWIEISEVYYEAAVGDVVLAYVFEDAPLLFGKAKSWVWRTNFKSSESKPVTSYKRFGGSASSKEEAMEAVEEVISNLALLLHRAKQIGEIE